MEEEAQLSNSWRKALLIINCLTLAVGASGGPLTMRLYFLKGGKRIWFSSWLETGGWPIIFIPLLISYFYRRKKAHGRPNNFKPILMTYRVFIDSAVIGVLTGLDDYLYAYGIAKLPISTATIVVASHLAFTALFAFLLVKQKFTAYSVNAVVLLSLGSGVLALHTSGDRPKGESGKEYIMGFMLTLAAAALYGLVLPMVELMYMRTKQAVSYTLVLEIQLVMCFFATAFCTVGMIVNRDFQAIPREAKAYELGEKRYYVVVAWSGILWQFFFLGAIGVISCASSLLSGVMIALLLPVTQVLAVVFFREKFPPEKGVALVLALWGFISYFYGEIKHQKKQPEEEEEVTADEKTTLSLSQEPPPQEMTMMVAP